MKPRRRHNPKRRIAASVARVELQRIEDAVRYGGNPEHKKNPGDYGLTPPAVHGRRPDKALCDVACIFRRADALALLRDGVRRGMVSEVPPDGFPQNVWAVTDNDIVLEAQLENVEQATYHGYPLPEDDPFRDVVLEKWRAFRPTRWEGLDGE